MSLQSQFFRGDQKLEAAAVSDAAHILPGATGPHVRKIQSALFFLDGAAIALREVKQSIYGPSTAQAVLAYKQSRNIINRSYQSKADNIVGKMTMASLDRDMLEIKVRLSRGTCDYGPRFSPRLLLNFSFSDTDPAPVKLTGGLLGGLLQPTPLELAIAALPDAFRLIQESRIALRAVINNDSSDAATLGSQALTLHFKVTSGKDVLDTAKKVNEFIVRCAGVLIQQKFVLKAGVGGNAFAETPTPRNGKIFILPGYALAGQLMRPLVLVHEAFHSLNDFHQDFGGNPAIDQGALYHRNDIGTQLKNAFAISQFVLHIHEKKERFLGDNE